MEDAGHRAAVEAALAFEGGGRTPVNNFALVTAARSAGVLVKDARYSPGASARLAVDYALKTGSDFVKPVLDSQVPFADMGMDVSFPDDDYGRVKSRLVRGPEDVSELAFFDPSAAEECPLFTRCFTEALRKTAEYLPEDLHVCGLSWGPITTAGYLMGVEDMLMAIMMGQGEDVKRLVSKCAGFVADQQVQMVRSGATLMWVADPTSSTDLIAPDMFGEYSAFAIEDSISRVKGECGVPAFLHICGNTTGIFPEIKATGADCFSFDHAVDIGDARGAAGRDLAIMGNIDPVKHIMMGTPEGITREAYRLIAAAGTDGGYILAPGCETPISSPDANVAALGRAGRSFWEDRRRLPLPSGPSAYCSSSMPATSTARNRNSSGASAWP